MTDVANTRRKLSLDEQVARARAIVATWPAEKRARMRLEGTDRFHERLAPVAERRRVS